MRVLVLDDNKIVVRQPNQEMYPGNVGYTQATIVQTKRVEIFLGRLFNEEWAEVWIDHDLGGNLTGRNATQAIHNTILDPDAHGDWEMLKATYFITTMNESAAKNMYDDLYRAGLNVHRVPMHRFLDLGISRGEPIRG